MFTNYQYIYLKIINIETINFLSFIFYIYFAIIMIIKKEEIINQLFKFKDIYFYKSTLI